MVRSQLVVGVALIALIFCQAQSANAQESTSQSDGKVPAQTDQAQAELFKKFSETLSGAKMVGSFTITGRDNQNLTPEEYHIKSVVKQDEGDYWLFTARIKYGGNDVSVPLPLQVKWAGDTPVITLTNFTIPAMGTFSARVVIHDGKYAGTWSHDDVGGHLFGTIVAGQAEGVDVKDQ